jgi:Universal stress protein family
MGPSTCTRVAEIMSGRTIAQQGLATTCKDRAHNGHTGGAGRVVVWRMSPYERRRGGNAPPGGLEAAPARVTPAPGKGALGTRWPRQSGTHQTQSWITRGPASWRRGKANSTASGRRVRQHRSFARWGKARPEKWRAERGQNRTREIRPSGIVEGLQETWPVGARLHAARAPDFYLDICQVGGALGAEPIVLGARGLGRVESALLGSVSTAVVFHAKRPVLVVPHKEGNRPPETRAE